jgi:voltage-gated potassium channel
MKIPEDRWRRQFLLAILLVVVVFFTGVLGYVTIERWSPLDATFMTVITLASVGYGETHPLSPSGRVFTIFLITFGVVAIAFVISTGSNVILEGQLDNLMGRRKLEKEIQKLKRHFIICGYGRMGRVICQELAKKKIPHVVIESHPEVIGAIPERALVIHGDATQDAVLLKAGIRQARGLVSVVSTDAGNVYITLTARGLCPDIYIVARAGEEGSEKKLLRAGANKVISPYIIGGGTIAQALLRPAVVDFIELVTQSEHLDLQMEEIEITSASSLCGVTLPESGIRQKLNIIVVAIKKAAGHMVFNPSAPTVLESGDHLIVLGGAENLATLEAITHGEREMPPQAVQE